MRSRAHRYTRQKKQVHVRSASGFLTHHADVVDVVRGGEHTHSLVHATASDTHHPESPMRTPRPTPHPPPPLMPAWTLPPHLEQLVALLELLVLLPHAVAAGPSPGERAPLERLEVVRAVELALDLVTDATPSCTHQWPAMSSAGRVRAVVGGTGRWGGTHPCRTPRHPRR